MAALVSPYLTRGVLCNRWLFSTWTTSITDKLTELGNASAISDVILGDMKRPVPSYRLARLMTGPESLGRVILQATDDGRVLTN